MTPTHGLQEEDDEDETTLCNDKFRICSPPSLLAKNSNRLCSLEISYLASFQVDLIVRGPAFVCKLTGNRLIIDLTV